MSEDPAGAEPVPNEGAMTAHASKAPDAPSADGDASLLALIDRLTVLLEQSDLAELEVEVGGTGVVLRKAGAIAAPTAPAVQGGAAGSAPVAAAPPATSASSAPSASPNDAATAGRPAVKAPLTGIFYGAPSPGSAPYVRVGGDVAVGQVIGLIEAMKLFNEIKSDLAGRVVRVVAESGQLVKARQPLIEVEPL
jgi:acetyl-CoA carboxylase biotin carboxyl carrier protein